MLFLSFALSIAIYTIRLDVKLGILVSLVAFGVCGVGLSLRGRRAKCRRTWQSREEHIGKFPLSTAGVLAITGKRCLWILLGNLLALLVVCGNLWWKDAEHLKTFWDVPSITKSPVLRTAPFTKGGNERGGRYIFNGFGTITDTQKYQVYLFENEEGKVWRLHAQQTLRIGDQIFLSANVKPVDTSVVFDRTFILPWKTEFRDYQFNYDKWMFMKGFDGTAYEKQILVVTSDQPGMMYGLTPPLQRLGCIDRVRAGLQDYVSHMYGASPYAGLLLGLLIGDKSFIPTASYDAFVESGLVHIIAVSGGNIAMVVILLSFLLKWIPLYVRNVLIIIMIAMYAAICGTDASVIRAAIMGCLTLIALFRGREVSIWRSMKYACVAILLFNPFALVYDVGFLLSFSAIIGIVLVQKLSEKLTERTQEQDGKNAGKMKMSAFWKEYLIPTIGASLGTAPILIFFMNGVNLVGILLNVVIVPIIPVVSIYGFASLLLYRIVAWNGWTWVEVVIMKGIYWLSEFGANYAIYLQAKNMVARYAIVGLFAIMGWLGYRELKTGDVRTKEKDSPVVYTGRSRKKMKD